MFDNLNSGRIIPLHNLFYQPMSACHKQVIEKVISYNITHRSQNIYFLLIQALILQTNKQLNWVQYDNSNHNFTNSITTKVRVTALEEQAFRRTPNQILLDFRSSKFVFRYAKLIKSPTVLLIQGIRSRQVSYYNSIIKTLFSVACT